MRDSRPGMNSDLTAGLLFMAFGAWFCGDSLLNLKIGNAFRMGPGYFPTVVGGLLFLVGTAVAINGWRHGAPEEDPRPVPWKAVILIPVGLVLFGLAMRPLGLVPALLALCLLAGFATGKMSLTRAAILSVLMTAITVGIFSFGLGINLPLLGDWLR